MGKKGEAVGAGQGQRGPLDQPRLGEVTLLRLKLSLACLPLVLAALCAVAQADTGRQLGDLDQDLKTLEDRVNGLEAQYINPDLLDRRYAVEARINEGLQFFLLQDYTRASVIFLDLVGDPRVKNKPAQRDSLYYLAECLYQNKNPIGARRHFQELLAMGAEEYYQPSVGRLIEIATQLGDHDQIENLYRSARSRSGGNAEPTLVYVYAKSQFFRGNDDEAMRSFEQVPGASDVNLQSLYFQGVILARRAAAAKEGAKRKDQKGQERAAKDAREDLDRSVRLFLQILELISPKPDEEKLLQLRELAQMALGRVYYEQAEFDKAIAQYQIIPRESENFDRALYEITWTFIKKGEIDQAQRNLDVLLLLDPEGALAPEARLLRGDLQLQLEAYAEAVETYQEVIDEYEPVRDNLRLIVNREGGAKEYFDALLGRDVNQARAIEVPPIVGAWVAQDPEMARNLAIAQDLDTGRVDVDESREIIEELEDAINSRSKIDIFPELKEGWGKGLEIETRYLELGRSLLELERDLVLKNARPSDAYRAAWQERRQIEARFDQIPKNREALAAREKQVKERYGSLQTDIYRLGYEIDSMRAQIVAMDKWMQDVKAQGQAPSAADEATVRESMNQLFEQVEALEAQRQELRKIVRRSSTQTGINDDVAEQEEEIKREFAAAIAAERRLLGELRGGQDPQALGQIDALQARVARQDQQLSSYFARLEKIVNRKVDEIRKELDTERIRVLQYDEELNLYTNNSESLANDIAQSNFRRVEEKFNDLILKADVGIIDVAWKRKEDRSVRIKALFESKGRDLKTLDGNFQGVLQDDEAQ